MPSWLLNYLTLELRWRAACPEVAAGEPTLGADAISLTARLPWVPWAKWATWDASSLGNTPMV
jgi:hypothetical protein